jgi:hypothetical protein
MLRCGFPYVCGLSVVGPAWVRRYCLQCESRKQLAKQRSTCLERGVRAWVPSIRSERRVRQLFRRTRGPSVAGRRSLGVESECWSTAVPTSASPRERDFPESEARECSKCGSLRLWVRRHYWVRNVGPVVDAGPTLANSGPAARLERGSKRGSLAGPARKVRRLFRRATAVLRWSGTFSPVWVEVLVRQRRCRQHESKRGSERVGVSKCSSLRLWV